jgi:hypothetical protein
MNANTRALRLIARKVGNPIGARPTPAELFDLVRRFRELSPSDREHVRITVTMLERQAERQERQR